MLIQTDDQDLADLRNATMPAVERLLGHGGTAFSNYIVATPACCPSRASLLTGQYPHNDGVLSNPEQDGGYAALRHKHDVLPVWLRRAGYVTAHVGKYLNGYEQFASPPTLTAPGWHEWHTMLKFAYYRYDLAENGRFVHYGQENRDYLTSVLNRKAVNMIRRYVPRRRPLYLELDQFAPHDALGARTGRCHAAPVPAPGDRHLFDDAPLPMPPSFNEADVSDKPYYISDRPLLDGATIADITRRYRCRLASLHAVDRGVARVFAALRAARELRNTAIIFISDNGYLQGEHRVPLGKGLLYEEAIHMPLIIRLPPAQLDGADQVATVGAPVANIDLAPTILRLAGAEPCGSPTRCRVMDGRSLVGLARGATPAWTAHRAILAEYMSCRFSRFRGIRVDSNIYIEHARDTGRDPECEPIDATEHYDLATDPLELQNLYPAPDGSPEQALEQALRARLARLEDCAGIAGRDPLPPSGHFCE